MMDLRIATELQDLPRGDRQPESEPLRAERLAPHSIEAEEAMLGSVLLNNRIMSELSKLNPDDFFIRRHGDIFATMLAMNERGQAIDDLTIIHELERSKQLEGIGGASFIFRLINHTPTYLHAPDYAEIIRVAACRRRLIASAAEIAQLAQDETMVWERIVKKGCDIMAKALWTPPINTAAAIVDVFGTLYTDSANARDGQGTGALISEYSELDHLLSGGGWERQRLNIVAGRPGHGKTSVLVDQSRRLAKRGLQVRLHSLETSKAGIALRMAAQELKIASDKIKAGNISQSEWSAYADVLVKAKTWALTIDDQSTISIEEIRARCEQQKARSGLDVVVVDYLQLIASPTGANEATRDQELGCVSRALKQMAMDLDIVVLAAAQVGRKVEERADKRPMLADLRESGNLEQDADIVVAVYRDAEYNPNTPDPNVVELILRKNRDGEKGTAKLFYNAACSMFGDLSYIGMDKRP